MPMIPIPNYEAISPPPLSSVRYPNLFDRVRRHYLFRSQWWQRRQFCVYWAKALSGPDWCFRRVVV